MSLFSNTVIAMSMSVDAFAASISKGTAIKKPQLGYAVKIGLIFGVIETITPLIGWVLGYLASNFITAVDHWIAFVILAAVGGKMIHEGLSKAQHEHKTSHKLSVIILTAIGTSIDAMAVGATLALLRIDILLVALMIGMATFIMTTIGMLTGHYIGMKAGKIAEILGGLCLIGIGTTILIQHLSA